MDTWRNIWGYYIVDTRQRDTEKYTMRISDSEDIDHVIIFSFACLRAANQFLSLDNMIIMIWLVEKFSEFINEKLILPTKFYADSWLQDILVTAFIRKILFSSLEDKIHIFAPQCNILLSILTYIGLGRHFIWRPMRRSVVNDFKNWTWRWFVDLHKSQSNRIAYSVKSQQNTRRWNWSSVINNGLALHTRVLLIGKKSYVHWWFFNPTSFNEVQRSSNSISVSQ
jgi:hypothetical protein